jgi:hypothetical protein
LKEKFHPPTLRRREKEIKWTELLTLRIHVSSLSMGGTKTMNKWHFRKIT